MVRARRLLPYPLALLAAIATAVAITYLVLACESLPGFMGGVAGDSHPRTALGAGIAALAVLAWLGAALAYAKRTQP